jgi:hypothetical protein
MEDPACEWLTRLNQRNVPRWVRPNHHAGRDDSAVLEQIDRTGAIDDMLDGRDESSPD